jgi:hypothetical protein
MPFNVGRPRKGVGTGRRLLGRPPADLAYSRLVNLRALPPDGFQVACFPLRIEGAGAAPARVVASVPESG